MVIELDEQQRRILLDLVDTRLSHLSSEIRHTDSPSVRQGLRDDREVLRKLSEQLAAVQARPA